MGRNNFSFERFDDLDLSAAAALLGEEAEILAADPENVRRQSGGETRAAPLTV